jgi:hypothetical protein
MLSRRIKSSINQIILITVKREIQPQNKIGERARGKGT